MTTIEPRVDANKLQELLDQAHESDCVEYIATCNLDERRDIVELATEVGALSAGGGYLVVGGNDGGAPTGLLDTRMAQLFDDATVRDKLARYLPDLDLHVGRHQRPDGRVVVIAVMPHPDGAVVFAADGAYEHRGKETIAFRKGELFVRHGSKSERPTQKDISRLRGDAVKQARAWVDQLEKIADLVVQIGRVLDDEQETHPDGRLFAFGVPTRIPTMRERLRIALGIFERSGGPELPTTRDLAEGSHYVIANHVRAAIASAISEIASVAQGQPVPR